MAALTLSSSSINGTDVVNPAGKDIGNIKDLMIHLEDGHIAYVVLSHGGFLGMGDKYFAIPWGAFTIDTVNKKFVLKVPQDKLDSAPGFDKDNWPDSASHEYMTKVYSHFGYRPFWERESSLL